MVAFGAVTILMDTLHQHFLLPKPRLPLRNKTKVKSLYRNFSSLQTSLEQDFRVGECDETMKGLVAQLRDACFELRFQIEHQLTLFYLGRAMKLRLHSAQKLLPILNGAIKGGIETMDFDSVLGMIAKHFALPVSGMPAHIKKRIKSFCTQHQRFLYEIQYCYYEQESEDEPQDSDDEQECKNEEEVGDEQESKNEQEVSDEQDSKNEEEVGDEHESKDEEETNDEQESEYEQENEDEQECIDEQELNDEEEESEDEWEIECEGESKNEQQSEYEWEIECEGESKNEHQSEYEWEIECEGESKNEQQSEYEWETAEEQDKQGSKDEQEMNDVQRRNIHMLCEEAECIITQELRAPSYLNRYMKQRIQARHRIRHLFTLGIKLIKSYIKKKKLKVKYAYHQSKNSQNNNNAASPTRPEQYMKQRVQARHRIRHIFTLGIKLILSYIKKQQLKVKNAYHQCKNSQNKNNTASPTRPESHNITVGDSWQHTSMSSTIKMVGCDDEFHLIMDKLNQQSKEREIVSIVGMGGIGKTTLARKIYEDASFISRFDCRAWVTVSQEYNPTQVLQCLLHSLAPEGVYGNNELAERVYKCLKDRRYLIVIDDIWSTHVWDDLIRCFEDDTNGSRILLTTRLKNVAKYAVGSGRNFCHNKWFLRSDDSWNLFCNKLSKRIILSPEFEKIAREIVKKCKKLPLAIIVVAGLLSNSKQDLDEWKCSAKNVPTLSLDHCNQQCENIIDFSYTFLPHHLKLCFLSFGCFPEDYEVCEDVIIDFWVSEGFTKVLRSKSLEDVAKRNLEDLVDRNLVIWKYSVYKSSRVYQMHDILRELALREAKKENLCFKEGGGISLEYWRIQPINFSSISQPWSVQSRIYRYNGITPNSNTSSHLKFLRVLSAYDFMDVRNNFLEIAGLVHLRRLKINCLLNIHYLPLFMFWNLQKLRGNHHSSCEPLDIWGLPNLRDLNIEEGLTLVAPRSVHHNLESIRRLDYRSCTKELFLRIPNLRRLVVTTCNTINPKCKAPNWFESLVYLYKLEELVVKRKHLHGKFRIIHSMGMQSIDIFFPNLKRLTLCDTFLKWKDINVVSTLSNLEDLKLDKDAVDDRNWEPEDGGFRQLKFLNISRCGLQCWNATSAHFPALEDLSFNRIDLKEIPSDFANIITLKSISLLDCSRSLELSAESIQKEMQEYGNDTLVDSLRLPV